MSITVGVEDSRMSFGDHLEELRKMLFRVLAVVAACAAAVFCFKDTTFALLLAPRNTDFITFRAIEKILHYFGSSFTFETYDIQLISTELSSQFMTHLESSCIIGALLASPFIIYELYRFVSPALYDNERRYSTGICVTSYVLFMTGVVMNYFILFPVAFRFLATYQVDAAVVSTITISSYISTFSTLSFTMGLVFELPVLSFILAKLGILSASFMRQYRRHSLVLIMVVAAFITPPDIFTLCLVTIPLYLLYEASILIAARVEKK